MLLGKNEIKRSSEDMYEGFMGKRRGKRLLPDIETAIFARMKGYVGGFYPAPLTGEAAALGYHPLSMASPDEIRQIMKEAASLSGE